MKRECYLFLSNLYSFYFFFLCYFIGQDLWDRNPYSRLRTPFGLYMASDCVLCTHTDLYVITINHTGHRKTLISSCTLDINTHLFIYK